MSACSKVQAGGGGKAFRPTKCSGCSSCRLGHFSQVDANFIVRKRGGQSRAGMASMRLLSGHSFLSLGHASRNRRIEDLRAQPPPRPAPPEMPRQRCLGMLTAAAGSCSTWCTLSNTHLSIRTWYMCMTIHGRAVCCSPSKAFLSEDVQNVASDVPSLRCPAAAGNLEVPWRT